MREWQAGPPAKTLWIQGHAPEASTQHPHCLASASPLASSYLSALSSSSFISSSSNSNSARLRYGAVIR